MANGNVNQIITEISLEEKVKILEAERQLQSKRIAELEQLVQGRNYNQGILMEEDSEVEHTVQDVSMEQSSSGVAHNHHNVVQQVNTNVRRQHNRHKQYVQHRRRRYQMSKKVGFDRLISYLAYDRRFP